jgi:hypothetical protein
MLCPQTRQKMSCLSTSSRDAVTLRREDARYLTCPISWYE